MRSAADNAFCAPGGREPTPEDPVILCRTLKTGNFSMGKLVIRPREEKGMQFVGKDTMVRISKGTNRVSHFCHDMHTRKRLCIYFAAHYTDSQFNIKFKATQTNYFTLIQLSCCIHFTCDTNLDHFILVSVAYKVKVG